ncbi:alpha/beta fold hydrolase [Salinispora arenicola]|uniref:alpha/beta fold hydrolase n=1 Tax=Salinispora arenicola TaxID=168697 RepID=UPI00048A6881|nr:alpha/beta hydrolase [Salinispora arenicola]
MIWEAELRAAGGTELRPVLPGASLPVLRRWLLLPGLGQTGAYWAPVARWLAADGIALLAADVPTLSTSCTAPRGSYDRLIELAARLADAAAGHGACAVVGHSAGAPVALLTAAATHSFGCRTAMLVDPVPEHLGLARTTARAGSPALVPGEAGLADPVSELRRLYPLAAQPTLRGIAAASGSWGGPRCLPARPLGSPHLATERARAVGEFLAATTVPVLVLGGALSAMLPGNLARSLADRAVHGTYRSVAGAGHSPHVDNPRETAAEVTAWYDQVIAARPGRVP